MTRALVGFILNKPMTHDLRTFVPEISQPFSVFEGGPVDQDWLYYVSQSTGSHTQLKAYFARAGLGVTFI